MKFRLTRLYMVCFIGLAFGGHTEAQTLLGQVRLDDGRPVAGAQVALFDLSDLRRGVVATTDEAGQFALPLAALSGHALPQGFALGANYPNPFNPATIIPYELAATSQVRLDVFNALGQRMATLVDGEQGAGVYQVRWDGTDESGRAVAAGVYLYRLTVASTSSADGASQTGRMVLVDGQAGVPMRGTSVEALPLADAEGAAYGLVVSGPGLVAYIDADFRVKSGMEPVEIEVAAYSRARMKQTQRVLVMGDVDNNGRVDYADALLVMAYSLDPSVVMPNGGDIKLGDVNGDGVTDMADAQLIVQQLTDSAGPGVEPPNRPTGLLTIPPLTLTVGSSYTHHIIKGFGVRELNPFFAPAYSVALQGDDVVERKSIVRGGILGDQQSNSVIHLFVSGGGGLATFTERYKSMTITGIGLGTSEVAIEKSDFGDAQTIPVTVVPRPISILDMTLEDEKKEEAEWVIGDQSHKGHVVEKTYTDTDNKVSYAVYELSMEDYLTLSRLSAEADIVLEEAWANLKQDVFLAILGLVPGLGIPTTIISTLGDAQMYMSIINIFRAIEKKSTKVRLQGLFAHDGSIIPGNRYLQLLMAKDRNDKDEINGDFEVDLRLVVEKKIRIDSESVSVHLVETIDHGPFRVREWTGVQIIPLKFVTFEEEEGRELEEVKMSLDTSLHNQAATYKSRKKGPALTVRSSVDYPSNSDDLFDLPLNPMGNFTLSTVVSNRSEIFGSGPVTLAYYCSQDPTIDPNDRFLDSVQVEALASLESSRKEITLPPPFVRSDSSTMPPEGPQSCISELDNVVYYGACVPDETAGAWISACSPGVPVLAFR